MPSIAFLPFERVVPRVENILGSEKVQNNPKYLGSFWLYYAIVQEELAQTALVPVVKRIFLYIAEVFLRFFELRLSPWSRLRVGAPDAAEGGAGSSDDEDGGEETHGGSSSKVVRDGKEEK